MVRTLLIEPLAYLIFLTAGIGGLTGLVSLPTGSINYITFAYPGIVSLQFLRGFSYSIYRLTVDRRWGLQALKLSTGVKPWSYLLGIIVVPMTVFFIQLLVTYPIALLLRAQASRFSFLGLAGVGIVASLFWTSIAVALSFFFKTYAQRDLVLDLVIIPLTFTAPVFYSLEKTPAYLQIISSCNPLTYQVQALRNAFLSGALSMPFFITAFLSVFFLIISRFMISSADYLPSER